eukprot:jgi/Mesvir1/18234/Mv09513-RA.1
MAKINGNSKRLSKNVIDLCDEQAVDTCPVWIHCLLAQKLGEWIEGICLVFAMNLVEKIAKNNADKVANDPLRDVLYHKGLEHAAGTSKSHAKGKCTDSRETTKLVWGKREAEPRPEDSGRSTKARMDNKVDELKLAEIEKQHEFRMREMQHQFDINIREMDRAALYRNTLVDDDSRLKRFRHMFQMIQVLADAESGAGPGRHKVDKMATFNDLPLELVDKIFSELPAADVCRARVSKETNQVFKEYFSGVQFLTKIPDDPRFNIADDGVMSVLGQATEYIKAYGMKRILQCLHKEENRYYTIQGVEEPIVKYVFEVINHLFPWTPTGDRITICTMRDVYSMPASLDDAGHRRLSRESADGLKKLQEVMWSGVRPPNGYASGTRSYVASDDYKQFAHMHANFPSLADGGKRVVFCVDSMARLWGVIPDVTAYFSVKDVAVMVERNGDAYVTRAWNEAFDLELSYFNTDPLGTMSRWTHTGSVETDAQGIPVPACKCQQCADMTTACVRLERWAPADPLLGYLKQSIPKIGESAFMSLLDVSSEDDDEEEEESDNVDS